MSLELQSKSTDRFIESLTAMLFFALIGPPIGGLASMAAVASLSPASPVPHTPQTLWSLVSTALWMITLVSIFIAMVSYFYGGAAAVLTGLIVGYFADRIVGGGRNILTSMLIGGCIGAAVSPVAVALSTGGSTRLDPIISFHDIWITMTSLLDVLGHPHRAYRDILELAPVALYPGFAGGAVATLFYGRSFRRRAGKPINPAGG